MSKRKSLLENSRERRELDEISHLYFSSGVSPEEEGSEDTYKRANGVWKRMLKEYKAPPLDPSIAEELEAFVEQRRAEIRADRPRSTWQR